MENKGFYGWKIVVVCGLLYAFLATLGLSASQIAVSAMALDPDVAMDRTMIGLGFTVFVLMQGLPGPLIGQLIAKKGAKFAYTISGVGVILSGILLANFVGTSTAAYILLFGVVLSVACTLGGQLATQSTISNWFVLSRGKAMSFTMAISGLLAFTFPIITNAIIEATSWHMGFYFVSVAGAVGLLLVLLFIKNKPADLGQEPDGGVENTAQGAGKAQISTVFKTNNHKDYKTAIKTPAFWLIVVTSFSVFCALNMEVSASVLHFTDLGMTSTVVATAVSAYSIAGLIIRLVIAPLADKIEPIRIAGCCALLAGISCVIGGMVSEPNMLTLYLYYICIGIGYGGTLVMMPTALANYFGATNFPKIMGTVLPLLSIFSGMVPTIAGVSYDSTGSYSTMFLACAIGVISAFSVRFPKEN